jgi:hypothetical protein
MGLVNYCIIGCVHIPIIIVNVIESEYAVRQKRLIVNSTECSENILTLCDGVWNENSYYTSASHSCSRRNYTRMDSLSVRMRGRVVTDQRLQRSIRYAIWNTCRSRMPHSTNGQAKSCRLEILYLPCFDRISPATSHIRGRCATCLPAAA